MRWMARIAAVTLVAAALVALAATSASAAPGPPSGAPADFFGDLRHTFSSRLLAAGIPLLEVSGWMGHSLRAGGEHVNTTSRTYAHATGEHREAGLSELGRLAKVVTEPPARVKSIRTTH